MTLQVQEINLELRPVYGPDKSTRLVPVENIIQYLVVNGCAASQKKCSFFRGISRAPLAKDRRPPKVQSTCGPHTAICGGKNAGDYQKSLLRFIDDLRMVSSRHT